jgi:phosphatidate cytidylyltransferase
VLTRILTGAVLGLVAIWATFAMSPVIFGTLCGLVISVAALEWLNIAGHKTLLSRIIYVALLWLIADLALLYWQATLWISAVFWVLAFISLRLPLARLDVLKNPWVLLVLGYFTLVPAWVGLVLLHQTSHTMLFFLIMAVPFADTGAYFVGKYCGKHKMSPVLSPNKTYEGLAGSLVVGLIAAMSVVPFMDAPYAHHSAWFFVLGVLVIVASAGGDLFESLVKRLYEVKDSGNVLPGHGGMLDRVDSLCAAVPLYALFTLSILPYVW